MSKILIADDEPLARARLRALLERLEDYQVVAEAGHGEAVLEQLAEQPVDIVLLDIRMPGMDGMQAAEQLRQAHPETAIIFTTAYADHALEAYKQQAVAYLLKPVRREALQEALEQACALQTGRRQIQQARAQYLSAYVRGKLLRIPVEEVPYLQASQKYVMLKHQGHEILIEDSLVQIEQRFPGVFLRIHRNALVHPQAIEGLERDVSGKHWLLLRELPDKLEVSRRNLPVVRQFLKGE